MDVVYFVALVGSGPRWDAVFGLFYWLVWVVYGSQHRYLQTTFTDWTSEVLLVRTQPEVDAGPTEQVPAGCDHRFMCSLHADMALIFFLHLNSPYIYYLNKLSQLFNLAPGL